MSEDNNGTMGRRFPEGLRQFFGSISLMANSPWGNGPKDGPKDGGDDKRPGPRNPWVTPDPADNARGGKPRGPSAPDDLLRRRPDERRGAKVCVNWWRCWWAPVH